jgi:hypothetical protein
LLAISAGIAAMGLTMKDVKEYAAGFIKGIKNVASLLGTIGTGIYKAFSFIKNLPSNISYYIRSAISKLPFLGKLAPSEEEKAERAIQAAKDDGTYVPPKMDDKGEIVDPGSNPELAEYYKNKAKNGDKIDEDGDKASTGELAAYGVAGALAYKPAKMAYGLAKGTVGAVKVASNVVGGITSTASNLASKPNLVPKNKPSTSKIKTFLTSFKDKILKKLGPKAGAKIIAKIGSRLVPVLGTAILAYDAVMIAKYMAVDGMDFKGAASKAIIGFNLFDDDEVAIDEDGVPVKPDEVIPTVASNNADFNPTSNVNKKVMSVLKENDSNTIVTDTVNKPANDINLPKDSMENKFNIIQNSKQEASVSKYEQISIDASNRTNELLSNVENTLAKSLMVQVRMADTLDKILEQSKSFKSNDELKDKVSSAEVSERRETLRDPAVDLKRKKYA